MHSLRCCRDEKFVKLFRGESLDLIIIATLSLRPVMKGGLVVIEGHRQHLGGRDAHYEAIADDLPSVEAAFGFRLVRFTVFF